MAMVQGQLAREMPKLGQVQWFQAIKQTIKEFMADDAMGMAAEMAYHFLFALFPSLLMIFAILGLIDALVPGAGFSEQLQTSMRETLPQQANESLQPIIRTTVEKATGAGFILGTGFILAIWSASSGAQALMKGFNIAYDVAEDRNFIKQKLVAIGLTFGLAVFLILSLGLLVFGGQIGRAVADAVGLGEFFTVTWNVGRFVLMLVLLIAGLALLYYFAPNVNQKFVWSSPGSILAGVLWLIATFAFSFYVNNFGGYSSYGVIGGIIALIYWLYISSVILLLGAELNGVLGQKHDPEQINDPRQVATGSGARPVVGVGGRVVGAGANEAKGAPAQAEGATEESARATRRRLHQGGHREPEAGEPRNTPEWRNRLGRQDPERVAAGRRDRQNGRNDQGRLASAGALAAAGAANDGHDDGQSAIEERRQQAPAKHVMWAILHDGGHALAIQGTRLLLARTWHTVFDQSPPSSAESKVKKDKKK